MQKEFKKLGIKDTIIFHEENSDEYGNAKFTGNFVQPLKYGEWERKRHEYYVKKRNEFFKQYKEKHPDADENQIAAKCDIHLHNEMKKWHKKNSENNPDYGKPYHIAGNMKYIPKASLYTNQQYYKTICEDADIIASKLGISKEEAEKYANRNRAQKREECLNKNSCLMRLSRQVQKSEASANMSLYISFEHSSFVSKAYLPSPVSRSSLTDASGLRARVMENILSSIAGWTLTESDSSDGLCEKVYLLPRFRMSQINGQI